MSETSKRVLDFTNAEPYNALGTCVALAREVEALEAERATLREAGIL